MQRLFSRCITFKKIIEKSENFKIIVNARTLNEIVRILEKDDDVVTIIVQKNVLMCV